MALQVGVPAFVLARSLGDPEERRFARQYRYGWQMYEGRNLDVSYRVTASDGRTRTVDLRQEPGLGLVHYGRAAPERLCQAHPELTTVTRTARIRGLTGTISESFPCR